MNSYGESQSPRARASVPGPGGAAPDDDQPSPYSGAAKPAPDAYRRGAGGRASVGSASARASVGSASVGSASVGSASVGSASVGSASVGSARVGGRASVGGSAAVARAAVRPSPAGGAPGSPGDGSTGGVDRTKAARKRRRTNILTAAAAVLVILLGTGVVGGTYFFDSLDLPPPRSEDQSNTIQDANGRTIAKLGDQNRRVVPEGQILQYVKDAVAAAEDKNFYNHHGIDMKGIVRAAWNNFTGGGRQGASTITQQYARHAADLKAISINRKLREAVIARKLESRYKKNEIMGMYLNYVYFGEGRYGIEAAANGYFGKSTIVKPGDKRAITVYEAAVLASIIKQPEPSPGGHQGYDPNVNPVDAKDRWEYTMANMLEMKWITPEQYNNRKYPKAKPPSADQARETAVNEPVGMVIRHVRAELAAMGITDTQFRAGGLTIKTTIEPRVQKAAERAGQRTSKDSPLYKRSKKYQAAVIGVDPNTGGVLGYYGGDDPTGLDYGGYLSGNGKEIIGGQSPGSTFKIYTLAAGLREDISFETTWDGTKRRLNGSKISNAGADPGTVCGGKIEYCDLETATIKSYNFPFYWIADGIGVDKVLKAAKDAGVGHLWTSPPPGQKSKLIDLAKTDQNKWGNYFDREAAFGQYRVVPLEHAEGVATIVGNGVHHDAHFVKEVRQVDAETGKVTVKARENIKGKQVFDEAQMSNLQGVMKKIVASHDRQLSNGREAISKSGTWEYNEGSGDCWYVGGIPQLAATVWVGGAGDKLELKETNGRDMFGSGTPARIWREFLNEAAKAMDYEKKDFPERIRTGNKDSEYANGKPPPVQTQPDGNCLLGFVGSGCENNGGNGGPGNNNGGPGGGNGGPGGGNGGPGGGNGGPGGGNGGNNGLVPPQPTSPVENGGNGQ